ncbi:CRE-MLTN-12 protein [Caenorhabditis remanei]|uniref:CRE-MLTN-12 protein n=1 Tax=Caenorhabditis remanei TaxID=31234 RepID=E3NHI0_CAERE|nr:CRE-MLTN-12 protein [Caenorhabditis remanei]
MITTFDEKSAVFFFVFLSDVIGERTFDNVNCVQSATKLAAMDKMKMEAKEIDKLQQLHYGWYIQAVSSLLGSVGKQMYMQMKKPQRRAFVACLDSIPKEYDVKAGAKCLVNAFDGKLEDIYGKAALDKKLDFIDKQDTVPMGKLDIKKLKRRKIQKRVVQKQLKKRVRTNFQKINEIQAEKLKLARFRKMKRRNFAGQYKMSPKMLEKMEKINSMKYRMRRVKRNILSLYSNKEAADEAKRVDSLDGVFYKPKNFAKMPDLHENNKSPIQEFTKMIREFAHVKPTRNMTSSYTNLKKLQDAVFGAREKNRFKNRMLDMVIGKNHPLRQTKSFSDRVRDITPDGMIDETVFGLVDAVHKHTKDSNANFLSPRFMPIMPEKLNTKRRLLSPDMFPLYRDESDNSILPIPNVLEKAGLKDKDRENVLELVMDITGVNNVVDDALNLVKGLRKSGLDKDLVDMTSIIDQAYTSLSSSLTRPQNLDFVNKKFSFMNKEQMQSLYGETGIYNTSVSDLPFDIHEVDSLTTEQKEESIRMTIRELAKGNGAQGFGKSGRRVKRQTISLLNGLYQIVFLNPTVFSPQAFAPTINKVSMKRICKLDFRFFAAKAEAVFLKRDFFFEKLNIIHFQLSVLGPLVLSPQLFCPSVLSPLLMSLPVISPQVGNPLIFSPYVLGPNVLSAAVFNAYVFSPYVLSPNVVNPYVMSPLVLSPFVLCPDVVSPTVLSGVVLSPSVLSPSIFTDSALAANVLSPTFLS